MTVVPNDGGQVGIVDHAALAYPSVKEAAKKNLAVLNSAELQHSLRMRLSRAGRHFSEEVTEAGLERTPPATLLPLGRRLIFDLFYPPLCVMRMVRRLLARTPRLAWVIACGLRDGYRGVGGKWKYHDQAASWAGDQVADLRS
jgi:hypothetical protein